MSFQLSKEALDFLAKMSDDQFKTLKKISNSLPRELKMQMPPVDMEYVEYVDVEKKDDQPKNRKKTSHSSPCENKGQMSPVAWPWME